MIFTLGFAFNIDATQVLLIEKRRGPSFNVGKWNGIGGKLETRLGENPRECQRREFLEETGIDTSHLTWDIFHTESQISPSESPWMYCLTAKLPDDLFGSYVQSTNEWVYPYDVSSVLAGNIPTVYNMNYLLSMAKCWHDNPERRWLEGRAPSDSLTTVN